MIGMAHKNITVDQVESGKQGVTNLGTRLNGFDTTVGGIQTDLDTAEGNISTLQTDLNTAEGSITTLQTDLDTLEGTVTTLSTDQAAAVAKVNEAVMAMASAPVTTPIFSDVQSYTILETDIVAATPTAVDVPNSKTYAVGKNNMMVLRNGVPQVLAGGDYTETDSNTITFPADYLLVGDIITFIINNPTKLNYTEAVAYYTTGDHIGKIETVTYTGDIARVITYTYNASGKIATEAVAEGGITTTKTYTYSETTGILTSITAVVA
jgi:YD repeat-containing protein